MNWLNSMVGALIEAWEEVKINRARVILSLIGVGAAVWAMATVIALGEIGNQVQEHQSSQWNGVRGTVSLSIGAASSGNGDEGAQFGGSAEWSDTDGYANAEPKTESSAASTSASASEEQAKNQAFRRALAATVKRLKITYWTTYSTYNPKVDAPDYNECASEICPGQYPTLFGVDPDYFAMYGRVLVSGRLLTSADENLQMNPVVVNKAMLAALGNPDVRTFPRIWLGKDHKTALTVVGVIKDISQWDAAEIYAPAGQAAYLSSIGTLGETMGSTPEVRFVAPAGQEKQAGEVAAAVLQSNLGPDYSVTSNVDIGAITQAENKSAVITTIVSIIGAIVILLGALGLLTVSVVTIKTRVREIGIRRAVGASAKRVFFAVFMESVVATTAAGFFGVIASVFTVRFAPFERAGIDLGGVVWAYPMQAALLGVLISASVGAICGIIPATIAVRMRPIDAIRF